VTVSDTLQVETLQVATKVSDTLQVATVVPDNLQRAKLQRV